MAFTDRDASLAAARFTVYLAADPKKTTVRGDHVAHILAALRDAEAKTADPFDRIAVLTGEDLRRVAAMLAELDPDTDSVRIALDEGVKLSANARTWTLPFGRMAGPTGY